jgi:hypothetical protein
MHISQFVLHLLAAIQNATTALKCLSLMSLGYLSSMRIPNTSHSHVAIQLPLVSNTIHPVFGDVEPNVLTADV